MQMWVRFNEMPSDVLDIRAKRFSDAAPPGLLWFRFQTSGWRHWLNYAAAPRLRPSRHRQAIDVSR
jgi:hypothetical protein